eukprot:Colp12_sorted_trinity150504_noHs@30155
MAASFAKLLGTDSRDFLVKNKKSGGEKVPITSLEDNELIAVYLSAHWCPPCRRFTPMLSELYTKLRAQGKKLEIIFLTCDRSEQQFDDYFNEMPWLAVPFGDDAIEGFQSEYPIEGIPTLFLFNNKGELQSNEGVEIVFEHGENGFPYTKERLAELERIEKEKMAKYTLKEFLGTKDRDYILKNHAGEQVKIAELESNDVVGFYFSAHWCPPCRGFTPVLAGEYNKLKEAGKKFEIVFVSSDSDQNSFDEYFKEMPWAALPFEDRATKNELSKLFKVQGIPSLVLLNGQGKVIAEDGRSLLGKYGASGFPYSEARLAELKEEETKRFASLPKTASIDKHPHTLTLKEIAYAHTGGRYGCDVCGQMGDGPVYQCSECGFDAHVDCCISK